MHVCMYACMYVCACVRGVRVYIYVCASHMLVRTRVVASVKTRVVASVRTRVVASVRTRVVASVTSVNAHSLGALVKENMCKH